MTREEQILSAAREYHGIILSSPSNILHFEAGAHWADKHPYLSSLWHDSIEEPKEDMDILFMSKNGKVHKVSKIDHQLYDWLKDNDGINKWAYISDLLPSDNVPSNVPSNVPR